jgi:gas vesicle structural protein
MDPRSSASPSVHGNASLVDVLDRVLDKGIVIDAWVRVALVGIDLVTIEARVVVASIDTYLRYAQAIGDAPTTAAPRIGRAGEYEQLAAENAALRALLHKGVRPGRAAAGAPVPRRRRRSPRGDASPR